MHPIDAKERSQLCKVNEIVADQLPENLAILLESPDENDREEQIEFLSVRSDEEHDSKQNKENISTNQAWKFQQPLAVV